MVFLTRDEYADAEPALFVEGILLLLYNTCYRL
jgi:hypothetical protein